MSPTAGRAALPWQRSRAVMAPRRCQTVPLDPALVSLCGAVGCVGDETHLMYFFLFLTRETSFIASVAIYAYAPLNLHYYLIVALFYSC